MGRWMWRKLSLVLGGLVACGDEEGRDSGQMCPEYGCYHPCVIQGHVKDAGTGAPIPGIAVEDAYYYGFSSTTDAEGAFRVEMACCVPLALHDVDGEQNGCYPSREVDVQTRVVDSARGCRSSFSIGWAEIALDGEQPPCTVPEDTGDR